VEEAAWKSCKNVTTFFWGGGGEVEVNYKVQTYRDMVTDLVQSYKTMGYNLPLKVHFFDSNSNFFSENLGTVSDEQVE